MIESKFITPLRQLAEGCFFGKIGEMKKKIIFVVLFLTVLIISGFFLTKMKNKNQNQVCFKNNCFKVELAVTPEEQTQGLMFRKKLKANEGMLFIFQDEEERSFWMKNTFISLDIIWINQNKEVVFISENTQPCSENDCFSINPGKKARYVLELKGETSKNIGLTVGEKAEIDIKISVAKKAGFW